jgi:hypothetical protein
VKKRTAAAAAVLLAASCVTPPAAEEAARAEKLLSPRAEERTEAFQWLLRRGPEAAAALKRVLPEGARHGYPAAALLYALGEGDAVPLDIRARHLAAFRWPGIHDSENAVVEAYAWREVERDLVRDGRPALRLLAAALERDASSEAKALQALRALLRLGGRETADALAGLLGSERDLGGTRVCDVAAAALLFLGRQETLLRLARPDDRLRGAREWWEKAKDQPEAEWTRGAVAGLAAKAAPGDPEALRSVLELLTGETIDEPAAWAAKGDWAPPVPPLRPESLLAGFSGGRPQAFRANLLLEQATGARVWLPPMRSLAELLSALRLWRPPADLALRWKRYLEGTLLRLSVSAVGRHPKAGKNAVLWNRDTYFHAVEEASDEFRIGRAETYSLYLQVCDLGTRLVVNEFLGMTEAGLASVEEASALRPFAHVSSSLQACVVVEVREVAARRPPRSPEEVEGDLKAALRKAGGEDAGKPLRALAYFQDPADLPLFRERKAGEALLLLGDPAAVDLAPRLLPHEIEMASRQAQDPRVKEYLERLRSGARP